MSQCSTAPPLIVRAVSLKRPLSLYTGDSLKVLKESQSRQCPRHLLPEFFGLFHVLITR